MHFGADGRGSVPCQERPTSQERGGGTRKSILTHLRRIVHGRKVGCNPVLPGCLVRRGVPLVALAEELKVFPVFSLFPSPFLSHGKPLLVEGRWPAPRLGTTLDLQGWNS